MAEQVNSKLDLFKFDHFIEDQINLEKKFDFDKEVNFIETDKVNIAYEYSKPLSNSLILTQLQHANPPAVISEIVRMIFSNTFSIKFFIPPLILKSITLPESHYELPDFYPPSSVNSLKAAAPLKYINEKYFGKPSEFFPTVIPSRFWWCPYSFNDFY
jgi:hypothetical protein